MKIPRKIAPDNLKDTIVQIRFEPKCSPELVLGNFNNVFKKSLKFISEGITRHGNNQVVIEKATSGYFVDLEEKVKINVSYDNITFNSLSDYYGWDNYFPLIEQVITGVVENNIIEKLKRIGVRYISQYDDLSIFDKLKMELSFALNTDLSSSQFRTEFYSDEFKIILTLLNLISNPSNDKNTSVIDIDVIKLSNEIPVSNTISECIDQGHSKQKEIFFSLLKDDFLKTLNPEY